MSDKKQHTKTDKPKQELVLVEVDPAGPVDIVGDPPLLWRGGPAGEFTPAEAGELLALTDRHGTKVCREAKN